jgi:hypothetical protein
MMGNTGSNNNGIGNNQQNNNPYELRGCLKVLLMCIRRYEHEHNFELDVYGELANLLGYKEPGTIRKWFNPADQTKTKMGVNDLLSICLYLGTDEPLKALYNDYKLRTEETMPAPADIKDSVLILFKEVGDVAGAVETSIIDGKLTSTEKIHIRQQIKEATDQLNKLDEILK